MYDVITVSETHEWKQFLSIPRAVYGRRSPAIPLPEWEVRRLLDTTANPALRGRVRYMLLLRRDGDPVGRCSLVMPRSGSTDPAVLGFFECINDVHAARTLLARVEELCLSHGAHGVRGPFSPTTSGVTGIQLDHFDEANVLYEACTPPYYAQLLEASGCRVEQRGRTWRSLTLRADMESLLQRLPPRSSRFRIRAMRLSNLHRGVEDLASVIDAAFRDNWSREEMQLDEYFFVARFLLPAWRGSSLSLVYDESRPAGVALCFPDVNAAFRRSAWSARALAILRARMLARRSRALLMFAIGMRPEHQNSPAGFALARHMATIARQYDRMYSTWITEGNTGSERLAQRFGLAPWRNFAVYRKNF